METSLILDFAILSVVLGLLVGLGTLSAVRGIFTFLVFIGLALAQFLGVLGVNEFVAYFLGQIIVMSSSYLTIRLGFPEKLENVKNAFKVTDGGSCHGPRHFSDSETNVRSA